MGWGNCIMRRVLKEGDAGGAAGASVTAIEGGAWELLTHPCCVLCLEFGGWGWCLGGACLLCHIAHLHFLTTSLC